MKKTLAAALALTLMATSLTVGGALAQEPRPGTSRTPTNGGAPVTEYQFDDHAVTGGTQGPDVSGISVLRRTRRDTLIQPRVHYINEMLKSVETL